MAVTRGGWSGRAGRRGRRGDPQRPGGWRRSRGPPRAAVRRTRAGGPADHEGEGVTPRGTSFDPLVQCQHVGSDPSGGHRRYRGATGSGRAGAARYRPIPCATRVRSRRPTETTACPRTATRPRSPPRSSSLAGPLGGGGHVPGRQPRRTAGRRFDRRRRPAQALRARHVPLPVRRRPARRATRSATSAPTCTAATCAWRVATCCTPWATTPSACRPSSTPCRRARTRGSPPRPTSPTSAPSSGGSASRHDDRRGVATTDVGFYRWTQWIFLQIFNTWYDADADRARPIAELEAELAAGTRDPHPGTNPSGAAWADLDPVERRRVVDAHRLAYLHEAPVNWCPGLGTVLANEEVTADGRSERGNFPVFQRPLKQWMMRITAYADRLIGRPGPARLARLDQADAAQLDRPQRGRRGRLRRPPATPHRSRLHHPARHAVRRHLHGARARAPAGRRAGRRRRWPDDVDPRWTGGAATPGRGGRRLPGRRPPARASSTARARGGTRPACSPAPTPPTPSTTSRSRSSSPTTC